MRALQVEDRLVELRCQTDYTVSWIEGGFKHKPEPDIVMFLALSSHKFQEKLREVEKKRL